MESKCLLSLRVGETRGLLKLQNLKVFLLGALEAIEEGPQNQIWIPQWYPQQHQKGKHQLCSCVKFKISPEKGEVRIESESHLQPWVEVRLSNLPPALHASVSFLKIQSNLACQSPGQETAPQVGCRHLILLLMCSGCGRNNHPLQEMSLQLLPSLKQVLADPLTENMLTFLNSNSKKQLVFSLSISFPDASYKRKHAFPDPCSFCHFLNPQA